MQIRKEEEIGHRRSYILRGIYGLHPFPASLPLKQKKCSYLVTLEPTNPVTEEII